MALPAVLHTNVDAEEWPTFSLLCAHGAGIPGQKHPSSTPDELGAVLRVSSSRNHLPSGYDRHRPHNKADGYIEGESRR